MSIWIISGINGQGKTSLLTEFGRKMAFDNERTRLMVHKIQSMNYNGFKLSIPEHTVASNYACDFRQFGRKPKQPRIVDPHRLGFQEDSEIKMHYIVPYQFFIIDEAHEYWPAKNSELSLAAERMFMKHRHLNLDFYMATPDFIMIHKRIRQLAGGIEVVNKKVSYDKYGNCQITWKCKIIPPGELNNYIESPPKERKQYVKSEKFVSDYDIHKQYNPLGQEYKFLEGHMDDDFDLNYEIADPRTFEEYKHYIETFKKTEKKESK